MKKDDLLCKLGAQLEYQFSFDMEKFTFLAIVMSKLDANIDEVRLRLVPDEVDDNEFWRNFFYHIELFKEENGLPSHLGERIDSDRRQAAIQEELQRTEEEIVRLRKASPEAVDSQKVAADDSAEDESTERSLANSANMTVEEVELQEI